MERSNLLCVVFFFVFLISCGRTDSEFDFQGHRGAMGLMPENTIPSFIRALDEGVKTIEFDVVISADSLVVVSHEPWFRSSICLKPDGSRISEEEEQDFLMWEKSYDQIAKYDCGSLQNSRFPDQMNMPLSKPTMKEAILAMDAHAKEHNRPLPYFSIETKSRPEWDGSHHPSPDTFMQLVYSELAELEVLDRVIIQSFDPRTLQYLRNVDASIPQAFLMYHNVNISRGIEELGYVPEIFSPYYRAVDERMIREAKEQGMKVIPWTVNDLEEMKRLIELGVDGLISDYPNLYKKL